MTDLSRKEELVPLLKAAIQRTGKETPRLVQEFNVASDTDRLRTLLAFLVLEAEQRALIMAGLLHALGEGRVIVPVS